MHLEDSLLKHLTYMLFNVIIRSAFIVLCLKAASSIDLYFFLYILSVTFFILEFPFNRRKSLRHIFYTIHALLQLNYISCGFAWFWCWPILKHALYICIHVQLEFDRVCINSDIVCNWHLLCSFMLTVMEAGCWKSRDLTRISRLELW